MEADVEHHQQRGEKTTEFSLQKVDLRRIESALALAC